MKTAKNYFYIILSKLKISLKFQFLRYSHSNGTHKGHSPFSAALSAESAVKWPHQVRKLQKMAVWVQKSNLVFYDIFFDMIISVQGTILNLRRVL